MEVPAAEMNSRHQSATRSGGCRENTSFVGRRNSLWNEFELGCAIDIVGQECQGGRS